MKQITAYQTIEVLLNKKNNGSSFCNQSILLSIIKIIVLNHILKNQQGWGYAVFGKVTDGMDIVDAIADVATGSYGGHQDVPLEVIDL